MTTTAIGARPTAAGREAGGPVGRPRRRHDLPRLVAMLAAEFDARREAMGQAGRCVGVDAGDVNTTGREDRP